MVCVCQQDEEYIPVQEMIHDFSQADYQAIAEREAALNEARAEHILAAQNRAQFETDQLTMKWQLAKAKMDAQNKLIEMQRHAVWCFLYTLSFVLVRIMLAECVVTARRGRPSECRGAVSARQDGRAARREGHAAATGRL
jgi:hypothetical protein